MVSRISTASLLALVAALSVRCTSPAGPMAPATTEPASTVDTGTAPCNQQTSFGDADGDARCILPPDPAYGMQFHYGPTDYDDPVEVAKYTLQPGGEVIDCVFFVTTNADSVFFDAYHSRMRPGGQRMILSLLQELPGAPLVTGSNGPTTCESTESVRDLLSTQTAMLDVDSIGGGAPENQGLAVQIPSGQQGVLQAHFINATSKPILREVWANLLYAPSSAVTQLGEPALFASGATGKVSLGQSTAVTGTTTIPEGVAPDFRLVFATGSYDSHTTRFTAWATVAGEKQQIIQENGTLGVAPEPRTWFFDSVGQNPAPDPSSRAPGAASGILHMQPGDAITWECDVTNDDVTGGIQFASSVYAGETCNLSGMVAPAGP